MSISKRKRKLITRTIGAVILAAVIIPAYFIEDGKYLGWVIRFGFIMALIEFATVLCESKFLPLHPMEYGVTGFIFLELLIAFTGIGGMSVQLLSGCIFVSVITDICAYLAGSFFGGTVIKRRPFPKTSPNKSYEGLIFGLAFGIVAALGWTLIVRNSDNPVPFWRLLIIAPISVVGDLIESRFKRLYDVKDANDFLVEAPVFRWLEKPLGGRDGHGGYLDRLDSLALAIMIQLIIP